MNDERSQDNTYTEQEIEESKSSKPKLNIASVQEAMDELDERSSIDDEDENYYNNKRSLNINKYVIIGVSICAIIVVVALLFIFSPKNKIIDKDNDEESIVVSNEEISLEFNGDNQPEEQTPNLSEEDRSNLRAWGFTAEEIEQFESDNANVEEILKQAKEKYIEERLDIYRSLVRESSNNADAQYQYVLANSWWGQEPRVVDKSNKNIESYTAKANVDYYKYPPQGKQYFIKVKFTDNGDSLFVNVPAVVYYKLNDSGNCIISYDYTEVYGVDTYSNVKVVLE